MIRARILAIVVAWVVVVTPVISAQQTPGASAPICPDTGSFDWA